MPIIKEENIYPSWQLTDRQLCDLELILNGAFAPLKGFMSSVDYFSVINNMRLENGKLWSLPITLDVSDSFLKEIKNNKKITLRDKQGFALAVLTINDIWHPSLNDEALNVYGTNDILHPAVNYLVNKSYGNYIGGEIKKISLPHHFDHNQYRHSPKALKKIFINNGWKKIIAFQTRNPLHRAHVEMTIRASEQLNAKILIHPVVGMTKAGDIDHYTRVKCYKLVINKRYPTNSAMLSLLPLAMRMGGPREALLHGLIRKNYGCTHMIVGRDHASPGDNSKGKPFYGLYDAQELLEKHSKELEIEIVPFKSMVYIPKNNKYEAIDEINKSTRFKTLSGTELRKLLDMGENIPEWFTYKEIAKELQLSRPPLAKRGFTIFFTGLSGAGKSTLANGLLVKLLEEGDRPVTLLDGDIVRTHLSSELGFSKEHRSINVLRIGYVASEITKNGGIAICAPIAPYQSDRDANRELITKSGGFIEVYVNTSLKKCEQRDAKGLYALARKGEIKKFTGVSDPYEIPENPQIVINSSGTSPEKLVNNIYLRIKEMGYIIN